MLGLEFSTWILIWILSGTLGFIIAVGIGKETPEFDLWLGLCLLGPLLIVCAPFFLILFYSDKKAKNIAKEKEAAEKKKEEENRTRQALKTREENIRFVEMAMATIPEKISAAEKSKETFYLIVQVAKKSKGLSPEEISGCHNQLLPAFRYARLGIYETMADLPEKKIKKMADELNAAIKRLSTEVIK